MKNIKYLFIAILSFVGISCVKADSSITYYFRHGDLSYQRTYDAYRFINGGSLYDPDNAQALYSSYISSFYNSYPYFVYVHERFLLFSSIPSLVEDGFYYNLSSNFYLTCSYDEEEEGNEEIEGCHLVNNSYSVHVLNHYGGVHEIYDDLLFYNFSLPWPSDYSSYNISFAVNHQEDPEARTFIVSSSDGIPSTFDYFQISPFDLTLLPYYEEINLNNYSYVALSLKDYSLRNNDINQFSTNIYTKGQLCLTPVYNYGLKEKSDFYTGYQVDRCSVVYSDFTPVRTYILKQDLENHAIYYLKAYDTSIENKVKIDTSIFDISYISFQDEDSPNVIINGRSYPTIPYNDLSSSSTQSEDQGYISGQVNNVFENLDSNTFSSLFSNPLNLLSSCWGAILAILGLVGSFIGLLPLTLQAFLYSSFALAIVLGIIKIIL